MIANEVDGEYATYDVGSESRVGRHRVSLADLNYNGTCTCEDFQFRCMPAWKTSRTVDDDTQCKHIKLCFRLYAKKVLTRDYMARTYWQHVDKDQLEALRELYIMAIEGWASLPQHIQEAHLDEQT